MREGPSLGSRAGRGSIGRIAGYDVVRIVLGFLLLVAAALKGHQLATEPVAGRGLLDSRWFLIGVIEFEILFGLWLWGGLSPGPTWLAALLSFAVLFGVSLWKALSGDASCGCFGNLSVNPWYTLALDFGAILALVRWRPAGAKPRYPLGSRAFSIRLVAIVVIWLVVGVPAVLAMAAREAWALGVGGALGEGEIVVVEPEAWIGRPFPLLGQIDVRSELSRGMWLVLLFKKDGCSACREAVAEYEELAEVFAGRANCPRIALVECSLYGSDYVSGENCGWTRGYLRSDPKWKVPAPTGLLVDGGHVQQVFADPRDTKLIRAVWGVSSDR